MKFIFFASLLSATLFNYASAACAGPYAQCGGNNFNGEKCCESGFKCVTINEWYSQCEVDNAAPATQPAAPDNNNQNQWNQPQDQQQNQQNQQNQWNQPQQQNPWENNNQNQWNQPQDQQQNQQNQQNQWNQPQDQNQLPPKSLPQQDQNQNQPQGQQNPPKSLPDQQQQQQNQNQPQDQQQQQPQPQPQDQQQPQQQNNTPAPAPAPAAGGSGSSQNFFVNEIYANPKFIEEIDSSIVIQALRLLWLLNQILLVILSLVVVNLVRMSTPYTRTLYLTLLTFSVL
eukprot:jgi/Orpsp1_1/1177777/evm.model.c7180000062788.1